MSYIWENSNWPQFEIDMSHIQKEYENFIYQKGRTDQIFTLLSSPLKDDFILNSFTSEIVSSNEIEGISISFDSVYSSAIKALEINKQSSIKKNKMAEEVVALLLDARNTTIPLTEKRVLAWHKKLFNTAISKTHQVNKGQYREKPVYIMKITGKLHEEVLYEGVPANMLKKEMSSFFLWINNQPTNLPPLAISAIASLWFVSIHPFEDGNGRISRLISDAIIAKYISLPYLSVSSEILKNKKEYYDILYSVQHSSSMAVSEYVVWFIQLCTKALENVETICRKKVALSFFMASLDPTEYNSREISVLYKLASGTFNGKLTSAKWVKITKCQSATATRDLTHLCSKGILIKSDEGGRSCWYSLNPSILAKL